MSHRQFLLLRLSASGGLRALAVVLPLVGLAACASTSSLVAQKEDHLAAAGFVVRPANTPQRQAMLNRLPPHHFVRREHGDAIHYVYADPLVCDCLYVGDQSAYQRYQAYVQAQNLADEQEMTAQTYQDQQWNWDNWGPWGPGFGPMGFGPGPFGPGW